MLRALAVVALVCVGTAEGATRTWKASTTGDWSDSGNWVEGVVPIAGDDVYVTNSGASAVLNTPSAVLKTIVISETLTMTNWTPSVRNKP